MELAEDFQKGWPTAEHPGGEQVALGQEGEALQPWILALADDSEHALVGLFQILQKDPFKLTAAVRILRGGLHLLPRKAKVALEHLLTKRLWTAKEALGKCLDLTDAELFVSERLDELVDERRGV
jgi:hypothetical protein